MEKIKDLRKVKKGSLIYDNQDRYGILYKVVRNEPVHLVEIKIVQTKNESPDFEVGDIHTITGKANMPLKTKYLLLSKGEFFLEAL